MPADAVLAFASLRYSSARCGEAIPPVAPPKQVLVIVNRLERGYPDGLVAILHHSDIDLGDAPPRTITLRALAFERDGERVALRAIDAVTISETLRDVEQLLAPRRAPS